MSEGESYLIARQLQGQIIELAWTEGDCLNLVMTGSRDIIKVTGAKLTIQIQKAEEKVK